MIAFAFWGTFHAQHDASASSLSELRATDVALSQNITLSRIARFVLLLLRGLG
jgi:hypothetical protein